MNRKITRRQFLGGALSGAAFLGSGCSLNAAWPVAGVRKKSLRLCFYTDVHARIEWETPEAMALAADAINARKSDIVIAGGDLITDGFQSPVKETVPRWEAYMKMHRAIQGDLYPAMGNHDLTAADPDDGSPPAKNPRRVFLEQMGLERTWYSFDAAGYHFVFLDGVVITRGEYRYRGFIRPEQMAWLKQDLSRLSNNTPIIVVTHIPLLSVFHSAVNGSFYPMKPHRVINNNHEVLKLFEPYNLVLVLQGHQHVYEMIRWQNTTFITGGAVCGKWWRGNWCGTEEGFCDITLSDNRATCSYVDYNWTAKRPANR